MADDNKVQPKPPRKSCMLDRGLKTEEKKPSSYFFNEQVERCINDQHLLLGTQLTEKEKEADVQYDAQFKNVLGGQSQVDPNLVNCFFDTAAETDLDGLIDDLRTLAVAGEDRTACRRFLDLLFVTRRHELLLQELQQKCFVEYDLADVPSGKFGPMARLAELMLEQRETKDAAGSCNYTQGVLLTSALCQIASRQPELVRHGLTTMAKQLGYPWDALLLARDQLGSEDEFTLRLQAHWEQIVQEDARFGLLKVTRSFATLSMRELALELLHLSENKRSKIPVELILAYRCLTLALSTKPDYMNSVEWEMEKGTITNKMCFVYVMMVLEKDMRHARCIYADLVKRAGPAGVPADIAQVCFKCHLDLVEELAKLHGVAADRYSTKMEGPVFRLMAEKWRKAIHHGSDPTMHMLKWKNIEGYRVMGEWMQSVRAALLKPLQEEKLLDKKMECVFVAAFLLPEMLRWAAVSGMDGGGAELLRLEWPDRVISISFDDDCLDMEPAAAAAATGGSLGRRSRADSVASARSAVAPPAAAAGGNKQQAAAPREEQTMKKQERTERQKETLVATSVTSQNQQQQREPRRDQTQQERDSTAPKAQNEQQQQERRPLAVEARPLAQDVRKELKQRQEKGGQQPVQQQQLQDVRRFAGPILPAASLMMNDPHHQQQFAAGDHAGMMMQQQHMPQQQMGFGISKMQQHPGPLQYHAAKGDMDRNWRNGMESGAGGGEGGRNERGGSLDLPWWIAERAPQHRPSQNFPSFGASPTSVPQQPSSPAAISAGPSFGTLSAGPPAVQQQQAAPSIKRPRGTRGGVKAQAEKIANYKFTDNQKN